MTGLEPTLFHLAGGRFTTKLHPRSSVEDYIKKFFSKLYNKPMKVAVVTGSSKGLGREVALALAKDGYTIVVHYLHSKDNAEKVLAEVKKMAPKSIVVCGDLTSEVDVKRIFGEIREKLGRVDLLFNNVGNFVFKVFDKTTNSEFRDMIESNLYSTLYTSREVLPIMRKQKSGDIINIGAVGCERMIIREMTTPYFLGLPLCQRPREIFTSALEIGSCPLFFKIGNGYRAVNSRINAVPWPKALSMWIYPWWLRMNLFSENRMI